VTSSAEVVAVCPLAALRDDGARWVQDGVAVVREGGHLYAFEQACPHAGASLAEGRLRGGSISCPQHGGRFRLRDGQVLAGPPRRPLLCYDVEEDGLTVLVRARQAPVPGQDHWLRRLARRLRAPLG